MRSLIHESMQSLIRTLVEEEGVAYDDDSPPTMTYGWVSKQGLKHSVTVQTAHASSLHGLFQNRKGRDAFRDFVNSQVPVKPQNVWDRLLVDDLI